MTASSGTPRLLFDGRKKAKWRIALAHGAGADMTSEFMKYFAEGLAERGYRVARFEFPYMADRHTTGKKRPPDPEPILRETWMSVIDELGPQNLIIGGKSLGGRIASLVADEAGVDGLICLGYPFHPSGKPDKLRVDHLETLQTRTLIIQGELDPFGSKVEVGGYSLSPSIEPFWISDGDHSYDPCRGSDRTQEQNLNRALGAARRFALEISGEVQ